MRSPLTRAVPAAAIIVAAGLAGFLAHGHVIGPETAPASPASPGSPGSQTPATAAAAPSAAHSAPSDDDAPRSQPIADALPDIAFQDQRGMTHRLSDWKGRPLLVNFWAAWCGPCREEIPFLERLSRQSAADGLQVIGVAVDSRTAVLNYARRTGIQYPLLIGEQPGLQAVKALGMEAVFPFSVFVDARGRIVTLKIGKLRPDQAALILGRMDDLDRGRISLATAQREISDGMAHLAVTRTDGSGL